MSRAGDARLRSLVGVIGGGASLAVRRYDLTNRASFEHAKSELRGFRRRRPRGASRSIMPAAAAGAEGLDPPAAAAGGGAVPSARVVLCANKRDLAESSRAVSTQEARGGRVV